MYRKACQGENIKFLKFFKSYRKYRDFAGGTYYPVGMKQRKSRYLDGCKRQLVRLTDRWE
ncbi:hypothetical protein BLA28_20990 [Eisenbergiella tayi]|nr:hypothetical protein BLA28_20990 [Eisenbergiella tayi]